MPLGDGGRVPDAHRAVFAPGDQRPIVRTQSETPDFIEMSAQRRARLRDGQWLPEWSTTGSSFVRGRVGEAGGCQRFTHVADVPQMNRLISTGRREGSTVRPEEQRSDVGPVTFQSGKLLAATDVPEPHRRFDISATRGQHGTVRRKCQRHDVLVRRRGRPKLLTGGQTQHADLSSSPT